MLAASHAISKFDILKECPAESHALQLLPPPRHATEHILAVSHW